MRKPKLSSMAGLCPAHTDNVYARLKASITLFFLTLFLISNNTHTLKAQCLANTGQIQADAFLDWKADGYRDLGDNPLADAFFQIFDANGQLVTEAWTDDNGMAVVDGLDDGASYRVEWTLPDHLWNSAFSSENGSLVQFVQVPGCTGVAALDPSTFCDANNPPVAVTCFVQGDQGENDQIETIVNLDYYFKSNSPMQKIAMKGQTGAVWGLAWKASTNELFSASFVKQYAHLGDGLAGGIYRTYPTGSGYETALFADLAALNYPAGELAVKDQLDCGYGAQVGHLGLGGLALSSDENTLYVVNIDRGSVVALPSESPTFAQMREYPITAPSCNGGEFRLFALKYYNGLLYVGGTCTAESSKNENDLSIYIFELDPNTAAVKEIFTSNYPKGYWFDSPSDAEKVAHWLTDIEFTGEGNMIISLSDRSAHRFCSPGLLSNQHPDILVVWKDEQGNWQLESNGVAGKLVGSGQGNGQGPGGGEFFGDDHWIVYPDFHPEVAMGSVFRLQGSDEVVLTAFDPLYNFSAGGLHRYNTANGKKTSAIELYQTNNDPTFGKASGLGDIVAMCGPAPLEIGNLVWFDLNKNGVQDADEPPVADLQLELYDNACNLVGRTSTDSQGRYLFNAANVDLDQDGVFDGLAYREVYHLVISDPRFDSVLGLLDYELEYYRATTDNMGVGLLADENDSDAFIDPNPACPQLQGRPTVRITTGGSGQNNHSFDLGFQPDNGPPGNNLFDLALKITTPKTTPVKPGELVQFDIQLFNQGVGNASSICIVDYLPAGMAFDESDNPGWVRDGNMVHFEWTGNLVEGDSVTVPLYLRVNENATAKDVLHYAEICGAKDDRGRIMNDVDSSPDNDPVNDIGGAPGGATDDQINDHGQIDEDDHDPVMLDLLDLALTKSVVHSTPIKMGEEVLFSLELVNEGNVPVSNIQITDYLSPGMEVSVNDVAGWVQQGNEATVTVKSILPPGEKITIFILVKTTEAFQIQTAYNMAEITSVQDPAGLDLAPWDFDSTPGNGLEAEDDQDDAVLPVFDMALRKTVVDQRPYQAGDLVEFEIEIFNQGNLNADELVVIDYLPEGMVLSKTDANGWSMVGPRLLQLPINEPLAIGTSKKVRLIAELDVDVQDGQLINIAEIMSAYPENGWDPVDFDSRPDDLSGNDIGGEAGASTDDLVSDHGAIDEDDHDPAVITISNVEPPVIDLSIEKRTMDRNLKAGDEINFELKISNEGEASVSAFELTDYMPIQTELLDPRWAETTLPGFGTAAVITLSIANGALPAEGLEPGKEIIQYIKLKIKEDTEPGRYINFVEISDITDIDGQEANAFDIDSSPDNDPNNDFEDLPGGPIAGAPTELDNFNKEDDFDFDEFAINAITRTIECACLDNATSPGNGQFLDELEVYAVSGQTWFIELAEGFYMESQMGPPTPPVPFMTGPNGEILTEYRNGDGMSYYRLRGVHEDGKGYKVILRNEYDERLIVQDVRCYYERIEIAGLDRVCRGSITDFEVINPPQDALFSWTLSGGGDFPNGNTGPDVEIQWNNQDGGPYYLRVFVETPDSCYSPGVLQVFIGQEAKAVVCKSRVQISIDEDCTIEVTPDMLLSGGPYDFNSYAIMLTGKDGKPIQNRTLGRDHLNEEVMAKVVNACTGNSCWSTIVIEDKLPPQIECLDEELRCNNLSEYAGPLVWDNCDPAPRIILLDEDIEALNCDEQYIKRVTRTYQAVDASGNESEICTQVILLRRINLYDVVWPDDRDIASGYPLVCGAYPTDKNGNPDPVYVGVPVLEGLPIYPYPDFYCNAAVSYKDTEVPGTGCVRKIMRVWRAMDWWCSNEIEQIAYTQFIEITDNVAPDIICPRDMTVTVNGFECEATVALPEPDVEDNCPTTITLDIQYPGGYEGYSPNKMINLPTGVNEVIYKATDACYNSNECTMVVTVEDKTPPVAICDKHTVVGLTLDPFADVYAATFDDGSYDGCWIDSMAVRRMGTDSTCGLLQTEFAPFITFCCADVGTVQMVEFRVWDEFGNANSCMVEVEVQDKLPPVIAKLADVTIDCGYIPTKEELDQTYGFPVVTDNCDYTLIDSVYYDIDQCREGTIVRWFAASDSNNTVVSTQMITIRNMDPFNEEDIIWPLDTTVFDGCNSGDLHPDNLGAVHGYPILIEDECDLTAYTWKDEVFEFVTNNDACFKIVRHWKVVNWCRDDIYGNPETFEWDQTIKVHDLNAPVILTNCDSVPRRCTYDPNCEDGYIELVQQAMDICTPDDQLVWEYRIDAFSTGNFGAPVRGTGNIADASDTYPIGVHQIRWTFEDKCGNYTTCTQQFEIVNCKDPIVYCKSGIIVDLMPIDVDGDGNPDNECIEIWAKDLDAGSIHPCSYPLTYSFGRDTTIKSITYCCEDLGIDSVEVCVTTPFGQQSCCITEVTIQDNNNVEVCSKCDCVKAPRDTTLSDCTLFAFRNPTPQQINSFPDTTDCRPGSGFTLRWSDRNRITPGNSCPIIIRTWEVLDRRDSVCQVFVQEITTQIDFREDDIIWPAASIEIRDCRVNIDPISLNSRPTLRRNFCGLVTIDYDDVDISDTSDVCRTIVRTWQVFTECEPFMAFTRTQIITVFNAEPPRITCPDDVTVQAQINLNCGSNVTLDSARTTGCSLGVTITNNYNNGGPNASGFYSAGTTIVTFTATDICNQSSMCQTRVTVIDTVPPRIFCPVDLTVNCDTIFMSLSEFGEPTVVENCPFEIFPDSIYNLDICQVGTITRKWLVIDSSGLMDSCEQIITFVNPNPFDPASIIWPEDTVEVFTCGADIHPDSIGSRPMLDTMSVTCDMVTVTYMDSTLSDTTDACLVVQRDWEIANSCTPDTVYTFTQIIIKYNDRAPILTCPLDVTVSADPDTCGAFVTLGGASTTDCSKGVVITNNYNNGGPNASGFYPTGFTFVVFTATDSCNQSAVCTLSVFVREDIPPTLICPDDLTVSCDTVWNSLSEFGDASATDNCGVTLTVDTTFNLSVCQVGTLTRMWTATDPSNNTATCSQVVTFENEMPFSVDSITWPMEIVNIDSCGASLHPDSIMSRPALDTMFLTCANITVVWSDDQQSNCMSSPCLQVTRTWVVTDSCQLDTTVTPPLGQWTFVQTINVNDFDPPVITGVMDTVIFMDATCNRFVSMEAFAIDCDTNVAITNNSPVPGVDPNSGDISGEYPLDTTLVTFTATDACCNETTLTIMVILRDTTPPLIDCTKNVKEMVPGGLLSFYPREFINNDSLTDNCTDTMDIILTFTLNDPTDTVRTVNCDSLESQNYEYLRRVTIYAIDESGNVDSCENAIINATDPDSICPRNLQSGIVNGLIRMENGNTLAEADVFLDGSPMGPVHTEGDGKYAFTGMPFGGNYMVRPVKDINPMNGVTTKDLVRIQQHILGEDPFTSPYQIIAADIDRSNSVAAKDLIWLRKMILGYITEFPNDNDSWRFVDAGYTFPDPMDPFHPAFPEHYELYPFTSDMKIDFIGVKVGDVTGNASANHLTTLESRGQTDALVLSLDEKVMHGGNMDILKVYGVNLSEFAGFQATFEWDPELIQVSGVQAVHTSFSESNFGTQNLNEGRLTISWNANDQVEDNAELFRLMVEARSTISTRGLINVVDQPLTAEAYDRDLLTGPVVIDVSRDPSSRDHAVLYQNQPNPFSNETFIVFSLPEPANVRLSIFDMSGKQIWFKQDDFEAGTHAVPVSAQELNGHGMFIYRLETADFTASKRMFLAR